MYLTSLSPSCGREKECRLTSDLGNTVPVQVFYFRFRILYLTKWGFAKFPPVGAILSCFNKQLHCFCPTTGHDLAEEKCPTTLWQRFPLAFTYKTFLNCSYNSTNFNLILHCKRPNLKLIRVNWKIPASIWSIPEEQSDNARTDTGRMVPLLFLFFLPSIILFWQFNQFCRLCNYLNRKPPGPSRPPCWCSWRVTLLLMEHFFHPQPKVAAGRCWAGHCWATWDSLPSQVWMCSLVHGNAAPGKAVSLLHPPASCLAASWENLQWGCTHKSVHRKRLCSQEPLQAASKEPKPSLYSGTTAVRTGNKSYGSQWFVLIQLRRRCFHHKPLSSFAWLYTDTSFLSALRISHNHNV